MTYIATVVKEKSNLFKASIYEYSWSSTVGKTYEDAKNNLTKLIERELTKENKLVKPYSVDMIRAMDVIESYNKNNREIIFFEIKIDETKLIKNFNKSIRTNVSVKIGLKELAKRNDINISKFLNDALSKELLK